MAEVNGADIRDAAATDAAAIRTLLTAVFPDATEADLVEQLERDGDAVLSLVATDEGRVVGHIMTSRMMVEADGRSLRAAGLAPVAVLPDHRNRGLGGRLIREALDRLREAGEEMVFLVGEPAYYRRFGFEAAAAAPFASPYAGPYFMALALGEPIVARSGRADYAPVFAGLE